MLLLKVLPSLFHSATFVCLFTICCTWDPQCKFYKCFDIELCSSDIYLCCSSLLSFWCFSCFKMLMVKLWQILRWENVCLASLNFGILSNIAAIVGVSLLICSLLSFSYCVLTSAVLASVPPSVFYFKHSYKDKLTNISNSKAVWCTGTPTWRY